MTQPSHSSPGYFLIFGVLIAALAASLIVGHVWQNTYAAVFIYAVALMKAYLVLQHFVHLKAERRWVKVLVISCVLLLILLFAGLAPDIVAVYGEPTGKGL